MMKRHRAFRKLSFIFVSSLLVLTACGSNANKEISNQVQKQFLTDTGEVDWDARKAYNESLGEVTYMTGYYYAASPPDIEAVLAEELGYFDELGLDVNIMPGLDSEGMKYLAAGKAQIASAGTPSIVIQSVANGANIKGIATFGHTGTSALMVMANSELSEPADFVGKTIGFHGALPANLVAMFKNNDIDPNDVKGVSVGYDPTILASGQIDALTIYKSNEPYMMEQLGYEVRVIDPGDYGAQTSFGVIAANDEFASANPTAIEDFLRAVSKAHDYAVSNPDEAIAVLASKSDTVYDVATEGNRWKVERELIATSQEANHGVGWQTSEQWQREIDILRTADVIADELAARQVMDNHYIDAIYTGAELVWPN